MQPDTPKTPVEWAGKILIAFFSLDGDHVEVTRAAMEQAWLEGALACSADHIVGGRITRNPYRALPAPDTDAT